jgi:hypothetical protein
MNEQVCSVDDDWIILFNGKDLDDWTVKIAGYEVNENPGNIFRVKDGLMVVSYDQFDKFNGEFGHIFYKDKFSHYILRVDYRVVGEQLPGGPGWGLRNSGVLIHSQSPESMRVDQDFPVSIEVQMLGGNGTDPRSTGNLCTPGTNVVIDGELITDHCTNSSSKTYHGDQWVRLEVEVHGNDVIRHIVNGEVVMEYSRAQLDETDVDAMELLRTTDKMLSDGYICLQAESHPFEFKNVQIKLLEE